MAAIGGLIGALALLALPAGGDAGEVQRLRVEILSERPHDAAAFTQGLLWHEGRLYESTGQYGESSLRRVDPESGEVELERRLEETFFGEGLARVGDRLIQLTWKEGRAFVWDLSTFEPAADFSYAGEGWGLCHDGDDLFMSDGTSRLTRRDPRTFELLEPIEVTLEGRPVSGINELECAEGAIYANLWGADAIVRIDPVTGRVTAVIDASALRARLGSNRQGEDVLNGIAYRADTATFLVTGKWWPRLFEVIFVE